jgi:hypothetical protein
VSDQKHEERIHDKNTVVVYKKRLDILKG